MPRSLGKRAGGMLNVAQLDENTRLDTATLERGL